MANNEIFTRISLKYDTYANWLKTDVVDAGGNLRLLAGELGICEVPSTNTDSNVAPTVLFKVGGAKYPEGHAEAGQLMRFKDLPWASAKAADVHGWAKAKTVAVETIKETIDGVETETEYLTFRDADGNEVKDANRNPVRVNLSSLATKKALDALDGVVEELGNDLEALTNVVNGTEEADGLVDKVADLTSRLDALVGTGDDEAVSGSIADAIDTAIATAKKDLEDYADQAEADAKAYTDEREDAINESINGINDNITGLQTAVGADYSNDESLDTRLTKVEAFFEAADHDGEAGGLNDALDTLVEIQAYLNGEGEAASGFLADVKKLNDYVNVKDDTTLDAVINAVEEKADAAQEAADTAQAGVNSLSKALTGYTDENAVKTAFDAINEILSGVEGSDDGLITRLVNAEGAIEDLNGAVGDINGVLNDGEDGTLGLVSRVSDNEEAIDDLQTNAVQVTKFYVLNCGDSTISELEKNAAAN